MLRLFPTSRRLTIVLATICVAVVVSIGVAGYNWYYDHYAWPKRIQVEVLGEVIVNHDSFKKFEGNAHWGQGMFRWRYAAPTAAGSSWMKYCKSQPVASCKFTVPGKPEAQVETSVSYENGVITVEEWWM